LVLGLWPDLRGESTSDRREKVQIAEAFDRDILNPSFHVSRMKLDYLPHRALVEVVKDGHSNNVGACAVVTENFGRHVEHTDYDHVACDF
jgi:hypothetical protein